MRVEPSSRTLAGALGHARRKWPQKAWVKGRKVRIIICKMPMLVVRVMKSMTYAIQEIRVITIMLNSPRFAIA